MSRRKTIKDFLVNIIPKEKLDKINRSFEIVGDIAICEIDEELSQFNKEIAEAIMEINTSIKTVLKKSGIHGGEFRTQDLVHIGGENKKETIYQENGVKLMINPETVYFSARLSTERAELMENLKENKRVLVMFSGAGPYSFIALKKQPDIARITSIEINPEGDRLAKESLKLNKNLIKKSKLFKRIIEIMKENKLPIYEKKIIENLNLLKLKFINGNVKVEVENLKLNKYENEIDKTHNELFKQKYKDIFEFLNEYEGKLFFDMDLEIDKEKILLFLILFSSKFDFVCKIKNKSYLFNDNLTKGYLLNYLELDSQIEKINLFDEIYMPLPKDAELFLDSAFKIADKNAIIHMYDFVHENEFPQKSEESVIAAAKKFGCNVEIIETRKVGQYSPRKFRVCCDFIVLN